MVNIRIDDAGKLVDIHAVQSSGANFLGDAVLKAWREAQPFLNVPKGLMNDKGEVAFTAGYVVIGVNGSPTQLFLGPLAH